MSQPDPLARVRRAATRKRAAESEYRSALEAARSDGHTFTAIAQAAGISRQGARQLLTERKRP